MTRNSDSGPLSQKSAGHMQNRKTKTNTNPSPDPNRYRRRCPDPNARIQKFIHYMAIATFAIADCHRNSRVFNRVSETVKARSDRARRRGLLASNVCIFIQLSITSFSVTSLHY